MCSVSARLVGIECNMTWSVLRQPLASTLEDLQQSDLDGENMRSTVFHGTVMRTRRAGKEGQRRDDCVGRDDSIICDLRTILDDREFSLRT
jgi:hypothetical protein